MALSLYANPYDTSKRGFYFKDFDEYEKKEAKSGAEEFEIEFIDGDDDEQMVFEAMGVNQSNLEEYFEVIDDLEDDDPVKLVILTKDLGYDFEDALDKKDDLIVYGEFDSDADFAMEYLEDISMLGDNAESYFDVEAFGRDMRLNGFDEEDEERYEDMSDKEIGEDYIDSIGGVAELGSKTIEMYFDWDYFARDLMMDMSKHGDIYYDPNSV